MASLVQIFVAGHADPVMWRRGLAAADAPIRAGKYVADGPQDATEHQGSLARRFAGWLALAAFAALAGPVSAQTELADRLGKARTEINTVENAADRAVHACERDQVPKCTEEARTAANAASRALYAVDRAIEALPEHSMPEPPAFEPLTAADITPIETVNVADYLNPVPVPVSNKPDPLGAFRFVCNMGQLSYDDPIAYPGQPGKSHLHHFFGNTETGAFSDYESLRSTGEGTCQGGVLNRSAYWFPALLDGKGSVVVPDHVAIYYKRRPKDDPECKVEATACVDLPPGLRAIFGTNYTLGEQQSRNVRFDCNTAASISPTIGEMLAKCPGTNVLLARIVAPDCWDGVNLDSPDHQSHLAYRAWSRVDGKPHCPDTHPYIIPRLTITARWAILPGDTPATWIFSSDVMAGAVAGATFHGDYMEAWEPDARLTWEAHCIDGHLNCSDGDLGNGTKMARPEGFTFAQRPRLVPVPSREP